MKKILLTIAILFLISVSNNITLKAEPVWCYPDCEQSRWDTLDPMTVEFDIGICHYAADFYVRKACGVYCDILLWRVRCIDEPPCNNISMTDLINIATTEVIKWLIANQTYETKYGSGCTPQNPGDCSYYWRVSKFTCWHWFENTSYDPEEDASLINWWGGIGYCDDKYCCLTWYKVCRDRLNQLVVTDVEESSTGNCPVDPSGECQQLCD